MQNNNNRLIWLVLPTLIDYYHLSNLLGSLNLLFSSVTVPRTDYNLERLFYSHFLFCKANLFLENIYTTKDVHATIKPHTLDRGIAIP